MCTNCNQNNCNGCTQEVTICNQCTSEVATCDCEIVDFKSDCIIYNADDIECNSVVVVAKNTILSDALNNIVSWSCTKFSELANYLRITNVGIGASIYAGDNLIGEKKIRKLKSTDNSVTITEGTNDIDFSVVGNLTYSATNIGTGANVYKDSTVVGSNTQFNIRKINTSNSGVGAEILKAQVENTNDISIIGRTLISSDNSVNIDETTDTIDITVPAPPSFGYLKSFYVNSAYVPTVDSPSDGSIIRPYLTYDEAKIAFIGTGDITTPQYSGSKIILQTTSTTAVNPTVNELILEFENNVSLIYTGTDLYMFDTEVLYPLIPKNTPRQDLTKKIKIILTGVGTITRTAGIGLVRGMGSNRVGLAQYGDPLSEVYLGLKSSDIISLYERTDYPSDIWDGDTTNDVGVTYESIYGHPHKYSLQLNPTTPLVYSKYNNLGSSYGIFSFGNLDIINLANTSIKVDSSDTLFFAETINFTTNSNYIATSSATKMVDFTSYYTPVTNKNYFEGSGRLYCEKVTAGRKDQLGITGVNNFFKITNNAYFAYGILDINSVYYVDKFINISDVSNTEGTFYISNTLKGSNIKLPCRYFIDTNESAITIVMPNSQISPMLNKSTTVVNIVPDTKGTLSTFFDKPVISGIDNFADDAAAIVGGLVTNSLYFNTTNNALDKV